LTVKDHIQVGGYVADLGLEGVDYTEDVTYQILPDPVDVNQTWKYYSVNSKGEKKRSFLDSTGLIKTKVRL
jgi:hypothetical protein